MRKGGQIIRTRWVRTRKNEGIKCRFVGMEFAKGAQRDDLFAGTPPLWAARLLVSKLATWKRRHWKAMVIDVSSAFLYADALREMYIELPDCDKEGKKKDMVGKLVKALYGTRDAPLAWQETLTKFLIELGFQASKLHPALFHHPSRDVDLALIHI